MGAEFDEQHVGPGLVSLIDRAYRVEVRMSLLLRSADFSEGDMLGRAHVLSAEYGFGCAGENLSPQLSWEGGAVPENTESWAISCFDPDAPTGCGFWHWLVVDIPLAVRSLPRGAGNPDKGLMPSPSLEIRTDFGRPGYGGPCPPIGGNIHRYVFSLYAVGVENLGVEAQTSAAVTSARLRRQSVARADLIAIFRRDA